MRTDTTRGRTWVLALSQLGSALFAGGTFAADPPGAALRVRRCLNPRKKEGDQMRTRAGLIVWCSALAFAVISSGDAFAESEWQYYGGNQWNERHTQLKQIDKGNVARLVPRRVLQMGRVGYSFSASPLVVDGLLYVSASDGVVQAFDLRTGTRKWTYQHKVDKSKMDPLAAALGWASNCCSNTSRGVAYADGSIFLATIDAKMVALDAMTGSKKWEVWSHTELTAAKRHTKRYGRSYPSE